MIVFWGFAFDVARLFWRYRVKPRRPLPVSVFLRYILYTFMKKIGVRNSCHLVPHTFAASRSEVPAFGESMHGDQCAKPLSALTDFRLLVHVLIGGRKDSVHRYLRICIVFQILRCRGRGRERYLFSGKLLIHQRNTTPSFLVHVSFGANVLVGCFGLGGRLLMSTITPTGSP